MKKYSDTVKGALDFATDAHEGQFRKYSNNTVPYIVHPEEVARIVSTVPHTKAMLMAALLHDTLEDTEATHEDILANFGEEVASLVSDLTDVSKPSDGNRAVRKLIDLQHTAKASPSAKTIKLADLISNSKSIIENDVNFARVYLKEKARLLDVLKEGDPALYAQAVAISKRGKEYLDSVILAA